MTPEEYRKQQAGIAMRSQQTVLAVGATSTLAGFTLASTLGTFVAGMNDLATRLADAYTAARLGLPPIGLTLPEGSVDRLTSIFAGVLEDREANPLPRLGRIAQNEPTISARTAMSTALVRHEVPARLQWILDPHPCPLCIELAGTYAIDEVPESHPHCECTVIPVLDLPERKSA